MTYWLAFPLALFILSPLLLERWGGFSPGDSFQTSVEDAWDGDSGTDAGQVRTSEGMIGPPRN